MVMNCPKCGFQQDDGTECLRCGIIFARYHSGTESLPPKATPNPVQPAIGRFRRFYRIFRWVCLAGTILVLFLILRPSSPPRIEASPEAVQSAETKIAEFQSSLEQGSGQRLEMDEPELNGWLRNNLALKKPAGSRATIPQNTESLIELAKVATGGQAVNNADLEQAQTSVRDVRIELLEDRLLIYALFDFHGMDLSLEIEGQPVVRDGYLRLEPSGGKLGSLPLMAATLQSATARIFDSPENKEKFKLPPSVQDIRVEQGHLIVLSR
jgi:hypothetical protein